MRTRAGVHILCQSGEYEGSPQCEYTHRAKNTNNITQTLAVIIEKSSTFPEIPEEIC